MVIFQNKKGTNIVFQANFEDTSVCPEELLEAVKITLSTLRQGKDLQKLLGILDEHNRKRLLIRLSQIDEAGANYLDVNECYAEVSANFLTGQDRSEIIKEAVQEFFEQDLTRVECKE